MGCKNFSKQNAQILKFIYRKLRRNISKANQDYNMKSHGKEEQEEASKGNQAMVMNSPTPKGKEYEKEEDQEEEKAMPIWDCGSPLYDSYELVSVDHIIDRHLMAFPSSSYGSSKSIITRFTHHYSHHDMVPHKVDSTEKSKGSFVVTSLSKFSVKITRKKRKNNEIRGKKNNEMRRGFAGFVLAIPQIIRCRVQFMGSMDLGFSA
ncbi:hypothetical protein JHK85_018103 [Glycine max]|nr:hypothetical protein JHK85_018103 [Glycine max]